MTEVRALVSLARPRGLLLIALIPCAGFGFALWDRGSTVAFGHVALPLLTLWLAWGLGHAGSLWLNAMLDRDEGGVLFGPSVRVPKIAGPLGYLALALSLAVAWPLGAIPLACTLICAVLAVLYSHPRVALKGRPLGGPLVNGVGYGTLSPLAGFAAADGIFSWRAYIIIALIAVFILGVYFAAQAFQADEDRDRGYRTLVVTHGPRVTLTLARVCVGAAALIAISAAAAGAFPRLVLLTIPAWLWSDRYLARWRELPDGGDAKVAAQWVGRVCVAGLSALLAVYVDQLHKLWIGAPPGGCGTAIVPEALRAICGS
ncbi:MAG: UbiA family prenyltransferase [Sandaracinaceae bacterium]